MGLVVECIISKKFQCCKIWSKIYFFVKTLPANEHFDICSSEPTACMPLVLRVTQIGDCGQDGRNWTRILLWICMKLVCSW